MSVRERPLHLAILGCGAIAGRHARTIRRLDPEVRVGFASRDGVRAALFVRNHGGFEAWGSYAAALADRRVDAVLIATPPVAHLDLTLSALAAGRHVIVEKPAFMRSGDVDMVAAAAAAAGREVLVAENYCYKPVARLLRGIIANGSLGRILFLDVVALKTQTPSGWRSDPALAGGGALFEGGVHWIAFMANLGLEVISVRPFAPRQSPQLSSLVVFEYDEGAVGTLLHSWEAHSPLKGLRLSRIHGTRGTLTFESNGLFALVTGPRPRLFLGWRDIAGYRAMFRDFLDALRTGREPRFSLERARQCQWLLERAAARRDAQEAAP